ARPVGSPRAAGQPTPPPRPTSPPAPGNAPAATACSISRASCRNFMTIPNGLNHRGLERDEPPPLRVELDLHAERQREVLAFSLADIVSGRDAERDRTAEIGATRAYHVERADTVDGRARRHGAEHQSGDPIELA